MKKIENNFAVTGFVGKDAEIRQFTTASVARFSLAIGRNEKNGEENNRVSAFVNVEAWATFTHIDYLKPKSVIRPFNGSILQLLAKDLPDSNI